MNTVLSILDKEHVVIGISNSGNIFISEYDNKEIKLPFKRFILPKKEFPRHAANK